MGIFPWARYPCTGPAVGRRGPIPGVFAEALLSAMLNIAGMATPVHLPMKVSVYYRGTSLIRNCLLLGPCGRPMPRALQKCWGVAVSYERGTLVLYEISDHSGDLAGVHVCSHPLKAPRFRTLGAARWGVSNVISPRAWSSLRKSPARRRNS